MKKIKKVLMVPGTIGTSLRRHALLTVATVLLIAASIILGLIPPLVLGQAVDRLTAGEALPFGLILSWFLFSAAEAIAKALREACITAEGEKMTHALRSVMSQKLKRLPASVYQAEESGSLTARFSSDAQAFESMFSSGIASLASDLGTIVGMMVVICQKSIGIGILLTIVLPFLMLWTRHVQKQMLAAHSENRKATAKAQGFLPQTLVCIRSFHVYNAEKFAEKQYGSVIRDSFSAIERTNFFDALYSPVILTCSSAVIAVAMALAGNANFSALFGITAGTAVTIISYVNKIFSPLESIGMEIQTIQGAMAGIVRIREFLNLPEMEPSAEQSAAGVTSPSASTAQCFSGAGQSTTDIGNPVADTHQNTSDVRGTATEPVLFLRNVSFSYDKIHPVLKNFSLELKKGEHAVLTGRTGAGKSTIFRLLMGLYEADSGTVAIGGLAPRSIPESQKRYIFACVEQQLQPVDGTVREQITLGNPEIDDDACIRALHLVGLDSLIPHLDDPYKEDLLSHGQNQLLSIARAVSGDPQILLLDEIASGLDSATEERVLDALDRASAGRTVLSISHRYRLNPRLRLIELTPLDT